ncbi:MAG: DMT family transporter [Pseudomonadota bacterium]
MSFRANHLSAVLWVLLSTALFTLIFAAAKFGDTVIGTFQILVLRYLGAFVTVLILAQSTGGFRRYRSAKPMAHLLRAMLGCSAAAAITWASANMPIADASAIGMLYGVLTVGLGVLFLGERVGRIHGAAVILSMVGAAMVMVNQGAFRIGLAAGPMMIALISAFLMAAEGLMIRVLSRTEPAVTLMLYVTFFAILFLLAPALWTWRAVEPSVTLACLILGPLSIVAQYCTIRGYRMAPLSVVGPVDYSWLIFATLLGIVAFDEMPDSGVISGGILIALGGVLLTRVRTAISASNGRKPPASS